MVPWHLSRKLPLLLRNGHVDWVFDRSILDIVGFACTPSSSGCSCVHSLWGRTPTSASISRQRQIDHNYVLWCFCPHCDLRITPLEVLVPRLHYSLLGLPEPRSSCSRRPRVIQPGARRIDVKCHVVHGLRDGVLSISSVSNRG